jgi:hypothetical protein
VLKERAVVVQNLLKRPPEPMTSTGTTVANADNSEVPKVPEKSHMEVGCIKSEKQKVFTIDLGQERIKSEPGGVVEERLQVVESKETLENGEVLQAKEIRNNIDTALLSELSSR